MGEILDRTVQIYRAKFWVFVGIAVLPAVAGAVIPLAEIVIGVIVPTANISPSTQDAFRQFGRWLPELAREYTLLLAWPAATYVASRTVLGEASTLLSAIWWCVARWKSWLVLTAFLWIALDLPAILVSRAVIFVAGHALNASALTGGWNAPSVRLLLSGSVGAKLALDALAKIGLSTSAPAWSIERLSARAALRRSLQIAAGGWPNILAAWGLTSVLTWGLTVALAFAAVFILRLIPGFPMLGEVWMNFMRAVSGLVDPLFPMALTLIYYDQRVRQEGYDIELLMAAAGMETAKTADETV